MKTKWAVVFKGTEPVPSSTAKTKIWCDEHTPTAFATTPDQIKGKGIVSLNGIGVRYVGYKTYNHGNKNLSFSIADALFTGTDQNHKSWSILTKIYEQGFSQSTFFNSVWANKYCRGFMYGYPTYLK